jgi:S1-C subfamily serine protease
VRYLIKPGVVFAEPNRSQSPNTDQAPDPSDRSGRAYQLHNEVIPMTSISSRLCTLAIVLTAVTRCGAADEPPPRVQIARIGKAASALVEVKTARGQGNGSAFCIHKDGWFLTDAHVAQGEITLVLNPSLQTDKAYPARFGRSDNDLDLALLQVDGTRDPPHQRDGIVIAEAERFGRRLSRRMSPPGSAMPTLLWMECGSSRGESLAILGADTPS